LIQINLKMVKFWEDDYFGIAQGKCENLGKALTTKSSNIIELDLGNCIVTIPPILLKIFQNNLTILKFRVCHNDYSL
jgi:hypothetical protein